MGWIAFAFSLRLLSAAAVSLVVAAIPLDAADAKPKWPKKLRVQLKSPQELLPVCWGAPQDCRGSSAGAPPSTPNRDPEVTYEARLRVNCYYPNGQYAGDSTTFGSSKVSISDARENALAEWRRRFATMCHGIDTRASPRGDPWWVT